MKRLLKILFIILAISGCKSNMVDDLVNIHRELSTSEELLRLDQQRLTALNESLKILQTLSDVLSGGHFISMITSVTENNRTGHHILFTNGESITIYDGLDGNDASNPMIGIGRYIDGEYYWTLNGNWLLDDDNKMVRVSSNLEEGQTISHEDSVVPKIEIKGGFWYISFDLGDTWQLLGRATGTDGLGGEDGIDYVIKLDWTSDDGVGFVLSDGTSFFVLYAQFSSVSLNLDDNVAMISPQETIMVGYSLSALVADLNLVVESDGYYVAVVKEISDTSGYIEITCPREYRKGHVNVLVHSSTGIVDIKIIQLQEKQFSVEGGSEVKLDSSAGRIVLKVEANTDYRIELDPELSGWLKAEVNMDGSSIVIEYTSNEGPVRAGNISVFTLNSVTASERIFVTQDSKYASIDKGSYLFPSTGGAGIAKITSQYGVEVFVPEDAREWINAIINKEELSNSYSLIITVSPNRNLDERICSINLRSSDCAIDIATVKIVQKGRITEISDALILIGRPNLSNDYTVALPIKMYPYDKYIDLLDCYVDWGDGTGIRYTKPKSYEAWQKQQYPSHRYDNVSSGQTFEIVITGSVPVLNYNDVPTYYRNSIKSVLQWGNLGIKSMDGAFREYTALESLPADEKGAFSDVESFSCAFYGCTYLKSIDKDLFSYASKAKSFGNVFGCCKSLVSIPEGLFSKCTSSEDFSSAFNDCKSLKVIPPKLFAGCIKAKYFSSVFSSCSKLTVISPGVFESCYSLEDLSSSFSGCDKLESVPEHLFDDCRQLARINWMFGDCRALYDLPVSIFDYNPCIVECNYSFYCNYGNYGETPYTEIDGRKVHLYERNLYPDYFSTPYNPSNCFHECRNMTDYDIIPDDWK